MKIGVTGHRNLYNSDWVKSEILRILREQESSLIGITSLAIGADQLFAEAILDCGGTLQVIIPCKGYASSFDEHGLKEYQRFLALATSTEMLPEFPSDEEAYLAAGKRVVDLSDLLVAIWNGKPAAGLGGTADIVVYARHEGKNYIHINPDTRETI